MGCGTKKACGGKKNKAFRYGGLVMRGFSWEMTARRRIRGREVKQRGFIRSRGGIYSTDPRQVCFFSYENGVTHTHTHFKLCGTSNDTLKPPIREHFCQ